MDGYRLGRVLGIDVRLHASWLIIAGLVLWSLATAALPADFPELGAAIRAGMAVAITALFFASLLAHELAHSVVAIARGIPVHRITFFLFGGMAQTSADSRSPGEEFLIAIAGPVCSLLLAGLFFALWLAGVGSWSPAITGVAGYLAALNAILAIFNLLPGYPMDGGRVLRAILWKATGSVTRATRWASRVGVGMAMLLVAYGLYSAVTGNLLGGLWLVLIALFIRNAARMGYRQHLMSRLHRMAEQDLGPELYPPPERGRDGAGPRSGGAAEARSDALAGLRREGPPESRRDVQPEPLGRDVTDLATPRT